MRTIARKTLRILAVTCPGGQHSDGYQAGHALTFKLDHSMGADHEARDKYEAQAIECFRNNSRADRRLDLNL